MLGKPRRNFFVSSALALGATVSLSSDLSHRLSKVLRMEAGAPVALFNGNSPLFAATLSDAKARTAQITAQIKPWVKPPPLTLILAMPKREAWESALRQATELGVTDILPLKTAFSQVSHINEERAHLMLVEAAEQSERLTIPVLHPVQTFPAFLSKLNQQTAWAYERQNASAKTPTARSILIGPEGGFSPEEIQQLQVNPHIQPFSLGPTILRTDTAVVAALAKIS